MRVTDEMVEAAVKQYILHGHYVTTKLGEVMRDVLAAALSHAAGQDGEQCRAASGEDAYVIEQMGRLLAEIAVIVNGPEPARTRWSYHDLPEKVRALQEQRVASPEIPFLATPMTDYSEGSCLRWEYEKGWNACREYALRALSRGVPDEIPAGHVLIGPNLVRFGSGDFDIATGQAAARTAAAIAAQRKEKCCVTPTSPDWIPPWGAL